MTLLTIVQKAGRRAGWSNIPNSAVGNTDPNAQDIAKVIAFAEDTGRECMERGNWIGLDRAATITGDGTTTLFTLPADWRRFNPGDKAPHSPLVSSRFTMFPLHGPVNAEELNMLKAFPATLVRPVWRMIGSSLEIWPALASAEIVTFNYFSSYWIQATNGITRRASWLVDTDTSLIDEDLIMKGALWRWQASMGLDYAENFRAFELALPRADGQQSTERVVSTAYHGAYAASGMYYGTITDNTTPLAP